MLNIIAHSHGGNFAFQASPILDGKKIDNLVTLGTPIRPDYAPNTSAIGNHINVYSLFDGVQTKGGFSDIFMPNYKFVHSEVGPTGMILGSATNLEAGIENEGPIDAHSALWKKESVWRKITPLLKEYSIGVPVSCWQQLSLRLS
jgi:hypothetical protein